MKKKRFISLQLKVFVLFLLVLILPLGAMGVLFYRKNAKINWDKACAANESDVEQLGITLGHIMESVKQNSLFLLQDEAVREYLAAEGGAGLQYRYMQLNKMVQNHLAYDKYLEAIDIGRRDGQQYSSTSSFGGMDHKVAKEIRKQNGQLVFMGSAESRFAGEGRSYVFARNIFDRNHLDDNVGVMQLYVKEEKIQGLFRNSQNAEENRYYIMEGERILITSDTGTRAGSSEISFYAKDVSFLEGKGVHTLKQDGQACILSYYRLAYPDWNLVNVMSGEGVKMQNRFYLKMLASILILSMLLGGGAAFFLSAFILKPLKKVVHAMKSIEKENFHMQIPVRNNDEIAILATSFNKMNCRLDKLVNQVHVARLSEKNAQIKALQAYINPHFLYNALDAICWMSRMEEAWETSRLVEALSKLLRMSVHVGSAVYTVKEELEYTKNYLLIQECRYSDTISFAMDVEEGLKSCETVSFILQPLIENAIVHGQKPDAAESGVLVKIYKDGKDLIYLVENDGLTPSIEELETLLAEYKEGKRGMSISGVHKRISLHYGEGYGLHFEPGDGGGLRVIVRQPYKRGGMVHEDKVDDC